MAITATFKADFSSFLAAVDKAEGALDDLSVDAKKVETSLKRMVDNFSGRTLIQEASLMTIAVEKAGGTAVLTAKELERVGNKANEAATKMRLLGYEVPAGLQKLADETKGASQTFDGLAKSIAGVASAFGVFIGAGAVVNFGKQLLNDADALVKLHDKTGVSIEGLQRFQIAGDDAGNTIDELTNAIVKMEDKLVSGDKSAAGALAKLGLSFGDLKGLSPENQFIAISDALRKIEDPAEQVNIAIDLFGKQGANVLPTLKRGFDDLKDSTAIWSEETVRDFDEAGDAIDRWWRRTKGITAEAIVGIASLVSEIASSGDSANVAADYQRELAETTAAVSKQFETLRGKAEAAGPKMKGIAPPGLPANLDAIYQSSDRLHREVDKMARAAELAAEKIQKFRDSVKDLAVGMVAAENRLRGFGSLMPELTGRIDTLDGNLYDLDATFNEFHKGITVAGDEIETVTIPMFSKLPPLLSGISHEMETAAKKTTSFQQSFGDIFKGNFLSGIKGIGESLKNALDPTKIVSGLATGGIASAINLAISGIGKLFGKLFDNPEKQINPIREAFVQAAGGLAELNKRAQEAGVTLNALLDARNPQAYQKAIEDLTAAFNFQDSAMAELDAVIQEYGFSLSELPAKLGQNKLNEQLLDLYKKEQLLTAAGFDFDAILGKQAESFQVLIDAALETGETIPEQLRGAIKRMIELGLLTDESGEKLTDIGKLTFAETLDAKFTTLIDTIQKLTDAISRGLGTAIANIPKDIEINVGFNVSEPNIPDFHAAASGFQGRVSRPTLFLAGEAGPENVSIGPTGSNGGGFSGDGAAPVVVHSHVYLDGQEIYSSIDRQTMDAVKRGKRLDFVTA